MGRPVLRQRHINDRHQQDPGHRRRHPRIRRRGVGPTVRKSGAGLEEGLGREGRGEHAYEGVPGGGGEEDVQAHGFKPEDDDQEDRGADASAASGYLAHHNRRQHQPQYDPLHPPQVPLQRAPHKPAENQRHRGRNGKIIPVHIDPRHKGEHVGHYAADDEVRVLPRGLRVHHVQHGVHQGLGDGLVLLGLDVHRKLRHHVGEGGHVVDKIVFLQ
mmetsp:Transcript_5863/g.13901  ORF Transcript_5863/g.13901 Transcript_5863/m.13901 type:complete len:215 (-) Transcript_5863:1424-2068(-)